jgi:hypothetical protein
MAIWLVFFMRFLLDMEKGRDGIRPSRCRT